MLRSIIEGLTKRIEELELRMNAFCNDLDTWAMYVKGLQNSIDSMEDYLKRTHVIKDEPIVITKPKPSHVIGKLKIGKK